MAGVLVVGAGQAGAQAAVSLRQAGYAEPIRVIGRESDPPYQRPPLSKAFLAGPDQVPLPVRGEKFFHDNDIMLSLGSTAETIDRAAHTLTLSGGERAHYDHLVLALGARARRLPVRGAGLAGVHVLRELADARALRTQLATARNAVVIGGGFLGLEFAAVAAARGLRVTVLETADRIMRRAVTRPIADAFARVHRELGTTICVGAGVESILGSHGRASAVTSAGGEVIAADLVVMAVGVHPNDSIAADAGLATADGVLVDDHLVTADPAISAIGDCARIRVTSSRSRRVESVQNATDQARCVAARLCGRAEPYRAVPWFWSEQGALKLQIAGLDEDVATMDVVLRGDPGSSSFSVFGYRAGALRTVESVNRTGEHLAARKLLTAGRSLRPEQAADESFDLRACAAAS